MATGRLTSTSHPQIQVLSRQPLADISSGTLDYFFLMAFHTLLLLNFPPQQSAPAFYTPAIYSCIFHPCDMLPHFPLPHFQRPQWRQWVVCIFDWSGPGSSRLKVKVRTLAIAPLTWVRLLTSGALQYRKWQLTGMSQWCRSTLCGHNASANRQLDQRCS